MKRIGISSIVALVGLIAGLAFMYSSRESVGQLTQSLRQLSLSEFVKKAEDWSADSALPGDMLLEDIQKQAAERLIAATTNNTKTEYADVVSLYRFAKPVLTADQRDAVLARLKPSANQTSSWSFDKLKNISDRMIDAEMPANVTADLPLSWLKDRDVETLSNVNELTWLVEQVRTGAKAQPSANEFTAVWTGTVTAPATGAYTFSISPLQFDFKTGRHFRKQTTTVEIAGKTVLDTGADAETTETTPISLTAGRKTPIRVEIQYACSDATVFGTSPAVARLFWEGPGMKKRPIPTDALSTPDGKPGLEAEYVLKIEGKEQTVQRVDSQIDFVWYHASQIESPSKGLEQQLSNCLFGIATGTATLAQWETDQTATTDTWAGANTAVLESLGTAQKTAWADALIAHPALLVDCSREAVIDLYRYCRAASPDRALELFGRWAQAHSDEQPVLSLDFYEDNRQAYRQMAYRMVWQYRDHLDELEEQYLTLQDGSCALPVAYTLCYGYLAEGRIAEWIEKLTAATDNKQLSGDQRVNWLLARAQAEEVRSTRPGQFQKPVERSLAGIGWIQEAALVSEAEASGLRAQLEIAARFAGEHSLAGLKKTLSEAQRRYTGPDSKTQIADWQRQLAELPDLIKQRLADQETAAQEAYALALKSRQQSNP